jgi:Immunity protein 51
MMGTVPDHTKLIDIAGTPSLLFGCGDLPAGTAVLAAGHGPNGYFWEGVLQYLAGGLLTQVELDPEAGMFCARGDRAVLGQLHEELEEYLDDPERIARLIREAEASGFQFDD